MTCPVCAAKSLGAAMMRDCNLGKKTPFQVATDLNCTYEEVMLHINESHELHVDENNNLQTEDVLLKRLSGNMNTLQEWTDFIIASVTKPSEIDRAKVQMLVQLTQEIRKTVSEIAELQGRKGPGDAYMRVQVLNAQVVDMTHAILSECCTDCQQKILAVVDKQLLASGGDKCETAVVTERDQS